VKYFYNIYNFVNKTALQVYVYSKVSFIPVIQASLLQSSVSHDPSEITLM